MLTDLPDGRQVSTPPLTPAQRALANALTEKGIKKIAETIVLYMDRLESDDFAEGDQRAFKDKHIQEVTKLFGNRAGEYLEARFVAVDRRGLTSGREQG